MPQGCAAGNSGARADGYVMLNLNCQFPRFHITMETHSWVSLRGHFQNSLTEEERPIQNVDGTIP